MNTDDQTPIVSSAVPTVFNAAAYKFATLTELKALRGALLAKCKDWGLKGTILLSTEGVNLFVAGERRGVEALVDELRAIPGLEDLSPKLSESARQPFSRMLVRIKKEIISFGVEGLDPVRRPAPKLSARELKVWLDTGQPVTLLDTRNDYEVKLGTFAGAVSLGIDHFREFPAAVERLPAEMKQRPIVMFCTGGIRCEKAGPFMQREGFEQIFQLDGGILKYFEECGDAHYQGECFVFDQRVGLDASLRETESAQCYACLTPLTQDEQRDARFVKGVSCPYCHVTSEAQQARALAARQAAIVAAATPLPGSMPYDNYRPIDVPASHEGKSVLEFLCNTLRHVAREEWEQVFAAGKMLDAERRPVSADHVVAAGERYLHWLPATREPDVNANIRLLHEDEAIIVLDKPAPLPLHPSGQFNRNTLQYILRQAYQPQHPRPSHRLDANTSGVVVFARTRHFAGLVQSQFERGDVEKLYLARVQGHPLEDRFVCEAPISAEAGEYGSRTIDAEAGLPALTEFEVVERLADGTALVQVRPRTGRTNQIRLHLWQMGWPICGEQMYLPGRRLGETQTHAVGDPPLCLLAESLAFSHPLTGQRVTFTAPRPAWARGAVR